MIRGRLSDAAADLGAPLDGPDTEFTGVSTDTRQVNPGQLFVALSGPNFDAHKFLDVAAARGAAGAVVSADARSGLPHIRVPDTLTALGGLAASWRRRFEPVVVGVTGSSGKTTVKEMLAAILSDRDETLVTHGNLNNEIGVPLTLFRLGASHRHAVIEMGANHSGEIARLAAIARPNVGIVTMAGASHLEGFGSLDGVAHAKGEMFEALGREGTAIVNADDAYAELWAELAGTARVFRFGLGEDADFSARRIEAAGPGYAFELVMPGGSVDVRLSLPGRHNIMNALAAAAGAFAAGAEPANIQRGLAGARPTAGRLCVATGPRGATILDDTYNANPASVRAAIDYLTGLPGRHWAVLGDMGELGNTAPGLHRQIGDYAREKGVERLFVLGDLSRETAAAFGPEAVHFAGLETLGSTLKEALAGDVNLLVKGSRMMRLERLVQTLQETKRMATTAEGAD